MAKFFYIPFAQFGNTQVTPDGDQSGPVSYYSGYGLDYQLPLPEGGAAIPISRAQMNGLFNDITGAIQVMQGQGVFTWTAPAEDFTYPINALVYYNGVIWQSLIANNTDTPGATANWVNQSANTGVPIGTVIDYAGLIIPSNTLLCDGTPYSRTDPRYVALFNSVTNSQTGTLNNTTTVTALNTTNLQSGFFVSGSGIQAGTKIQSITNSTTLVLSLAATSASTLVPLVFAPWGIGDGSTTFNVPDLRRKTTVGSGGTPTAYSGLQSNVVGNSGGFEQHTQLEVELAAHSHTGSLIRINGITSANNTGVDGNLVNAGSSSTAAALQISSDGGNQPMSLMQPSAVMYKCIKFQ